MLRTGPHVYIDSVAMSDLATTSTSRSVIVAMGSIIVDVECAETQDKKHETHVGSLLPCSTS